MPTLNSVWVEQILYNEHIRAKDQPLAYEHWMKNYILGATGEVSEILDEINWKAHRKGHPMNKQNLGRELADLTKYVLSMWEWSGFTAEQMLDMVHEKSVELGLQYTMDFEFEIEPTAAVVITDIDGTIGDWRTAFRNWLLATNKFSMPYDPSSSLAFEIDAKLPYPEYSRLKEEFEASGGYLSLPFYTDALATLLDLQKSECVILAYTARPARHHTRIWSDTCNWLRKVGLETVIQELRIGAEDRISRACQLMEEGHKVVLLEDDPGLAIRAASAGVIVFLRAQPYNAGVSHPNIERVDKFEFSQIIRYL